MVTPYICPAYPGPLKIPALTVQHAETHMREDHKALIRVFREVVDLQKAVIKQIMKAMHLVYIKTLRDRSMSTIQADVPTVLAYLFTTYGTIEPEVVREHKLKVREMAYDLMDPSATSTTKSRNLSTLALRWLTRIHSHKL